MVRAGLLVQLKLSMIDTVSEQGILLVFCYLLLIPQVVALSKITACLRDVMVVKSQILGITLKKLVLLLAVKWVILLLVILIPCLLASIMLLDLSQVVMTLLKFNQNVLNNANQVMLNNGVQIKLKLLVVLTL